MIQLQYSARVDAEKCTACKLCERICPAGAIATVEKTAVIDDDRCIDCQRCIDRCDKVNAVERILRPEEVVRFVDHSDLDPAEIKRICSAGGINPEIPVCACNPVLGKELVASILKGAKTPEDVCAMTGLRIGCGIYCVTNIFKALEAAGIALENPEDHRWYKLTLSLKDVSEAKAREINGRHPGTCMAEEWKNYSESRFPAVGVRKEDGHV
jgi:NAD-dependent dihydropyrimidine dehydrogenase PreA subunit/bacterioferritin-associated ferredoxin